jgi:hypothetical protein
LEWAGIPFYGLNRDDAKQHEMRNNKHIKKLLMQTDKNLDYDYRLVAHFHNKNMLGNTFMNGSMIGPENFGRNTLHVAQAPSQKFFGLNEKYGISWLYDLFTCDDRGNDFIYDSELMENVSQDAMIEIYDPFFGVDGFNSFQEANNY